MGPRGDAVGLRGDAVGPRGDAVGPRGDAVGASGMPSGPISGLYLLVMALSQHGDGGVFSSRTTQAFERPFLHFQLDI